MKIPNSLERLVSRKLGKTVWLTGSMASNPGKLSIGFADHRIVVPARQWEFGSCGRVLMFATSNETILFVKKTNKEAHISWQNRKTS